MHLFSPAARRASTAVTPHLIPLASTSPRIDARDSGQLEPRLLEHKSTASWCPRRLRHGALALVVMVLALVAAPISDARAQPAVDSAFSNEILPTLGLPTMDLTISADGLAGAPAETAAGRYVVNLTADGVVGYLLFARPPAGLTEAEELEQAKAAGSDDTQQAGWVYAGGSNADPDTTVQVVVDVSPGDWTIFASHLAPGADFETDEVYTATRLTVTSTDAAAAPAGSPVAGLPVDVRVDMRDAAYVMDDETIGSGPKLWEFANTGDTQSHHMVMMKTPYLIEQADMDAFAAGPEAATPGAADWFSQITFVGYTALVSPGYTVVNEFDLDPGTYLMMCFIVDSEMGMPHFLMGMWTPFTVAG